MSYRYVVFDVGCIECIGNGTSDPKIVLTTSDLNAAMESVAVTKWYGDADRFAFDQLSMSIVSVSQSETDSATD